MSWSPSLAFGFVVERVTGTNSCLGIHLIEMILLFFVDCGQRLEEWRVEYA